MAKSPHPDIEMLQIIAKAFGDLNEKMVFVGGATTTLYIDDEGSPESLATVDIDCTLELSSALSFEDLEKELALRGFKHPMVPDEPAPMCRYIYKGIEVDVMPSDPKYIGFSNVWYPEGIKNRIKVTLPNGEKIHVFALPFFLATKIEAMKSRGGKDLRFSHDLEDIILILSGCSTVLSQLESAPKHLHAFLKKEFSGMLKNPYFKEAVGTALFSNGEDVVRRDRVIMLVSKFVGTVVRRKS